MSFSKSFWIFALIVSLSAGTASGNARARTTSVDMIKHYGGLATTMGGVMCASGMVFYHKYAKKIAKGDTEEQALSHGFTAAIQYVLVPVILVPTAQVLMSKLKSTRMGAWLGFDHEIDMHKAIAVLFLAAAGGHTVCELVADPNVIHSHEGKTGLVMWSAISVPIVGSYLLKDLPYWRDQVTYVYRFLRPHQLGFLVFAGAYAIHDGKKLIPWIAVPVAGLAGDKIIEYLFYTRTTKVVDARTQGSQVILTLERPSGIMGSKIKIKPGQSVHLKIQGEFHPFTIARFDENQLSFVISAVGPHTQKFYDQVEKGELPNGSSIKIRGPFSSALERLSDESNVLISSGAGISVSTAQLERLIESHTESDAEKSAVLVHSARNPKEFKFLVNSVADAKEELQVKGVYLFLTQGGQGQEPSEEPSQEIEELREMIHGSGMELIDLDADSDLEGDPVSGESALNVNSDAVPFFLHRGRMNEDQLRPLLLENSEARAVICGNPNVVKRVQRLCRELGVEYATESYQR